MSMKRLPEGAMEVNRHGTNNHFRVRRARAAARKNEERGEKGVCAGDACRRSDQRKVLYS